MVTIHVKVPEDLRRQVKAKAAGEGRTMTEAVTYLMRGWVQERPSADGKREEQDR